MKLHPREQVVGKAKLKLLECLIDVQKTLTEGEYLRVVTETLSESVLTVAKYKIREERHGDLNKPGGQA